MSMREDYERSFGVPYPEEEKRMTTIKQLRHCAAHHQAVTLSSDDLKFVLSEFDAREEEIKKAAHLLLGCSERLVIAGQEIVELRSGLSGAIEMMNKSHFREVETAKELRQVRAELKGLQDSILAWRPK